MSAKASEPVGDLAARLRYQAGHCAHLGSNLYAFLLEQAAADVEADGPVAQLLAGHEDDPADSMLALRMMGAVHRRVLEGHHLELGRRYRDRDLSEATWRAFQQVIAEDAESLQRLLDHPVQAGAAEWIAAQLAERVAGVATVVFHSVVIQYLSEEEREELLGQLRTAGEGADETAPLAWLRMEPGGKQAEVRLTLWPGGQDLLLARAGYHGDPVTLLAPE